MEETMKNLELQKRANDVRKGIVTAVHGAKAGHPGGSLSAADIFTFLYFEEMNIDPQNPDMEERDRFVLSKGHTAPGLCVTWVPICRVIPASISPAWICLPDPWDRAFPQQ